MLTIRFARVGKKNKPQFKIMLQEHTIAPGGTHVEVLGSYDPHRKLAVLKEERIKYWISQGVQLSDTVHNLFVSKGILTSEKRKVKIPAKKVEPASAKATADKEAPAEVKPEEKKSEVAEAPKAEPSNAKALADKEVKAEEKKEVIAEKPKEEVKSEAKKEEGPVEAAPVDKV